MRTRMSGILLLGLSMRSVYSRLSALEISHGQPQIDDWQTRQKAAEALGEIGNEKAIEPLRNQAVNDENEDVRQTATRALERIISK